MNTQNNLKAKALLFLLLMAAGGMAKGQTHHEREHLWEDLPLENTAWVHFYQSLMVDSTYFQIGIKGDTVANRESYKKVFNCSHLGFPIEGECFGGIRQDNDKYYFISLYSEYDYIPWPLELNVHKDTEYIIYDFSLSECDRFPTIGDVDPEFVFLKEDMEINGNIKQVLWFDYNDCETGPHYYDYHWIEGIGSNCGLLYSLQSGIWDGSYHRLVEILQDGESLYMAPEFAEIDYTSTKEAYENKVSLYPNPITDMGILDFGGADIFERLSILTMDGRIVKRETITGKASCRINKQEFGSGMYYYILSGKGKNTIIGKIIIN